MKSDAKKVSMISNADEKDLQVGTITDLDEGEVFLHENGFTHDAVQTLLDDAPRNKALVRKVDMVLLPLLAKTYMLQYIDKSALVYSAVFDLLTSTHMSSNEYSWLAKYPWNMLAQKTRLAKVISGNVVAWGSMLMITAACHNFTGIAICRFLLGIFEAPITPCFMMIVTMWYTCEQQPFRAGVFYSCNGLGAMVGGILTYGIGQIETIAVWRAIFLILGGITVAWGVVMFLFLPDDVISAKRFTLEEKALLIGRSRLGRTGVMNYQIKWYQIREALADAEVWILYTWHSPGAFQIFWILSGTFLASRVRNFHTTVMVMYLVPTIIGICLLWKLPHETHKVGVLFGYYLSGAYVCSLVLALQMPATNRGGYTKKSTGVALVFFAYCAGNVIGPHAFLSKEAPIYETGCRVMLSFAAAQIALAICLRILLTRSNRQSDAAAASSQAIADMSEYDELADLTDFENLNFRYVL
ncbi:uncharacterized protein N7477_002271 [Penicillium maclennaniae]|uniref:uncharacterized protein n=1 Tax=Penicillium maclennaniae TaxID=1343394 RepID=UPI002540F225|nr:uncharacterized protein N7477_002271 [Penicillium maclennaniae]KAJ5676638.1 hypothetical protein N7477_002271 [Penicillium maclennaniae]